MDQRRGGTISLQTNGEIQNAKGEFTINLGRVKREAIIGADGVHGYKETPQVPFIEGAITDRASLDVKALVDFKDGTVTIETATGKVYVLRDAWYAGEGTLNTSEGEIGVRYEGMSGEEIR